MTFHIDWFSFALALLVFLLLYHITKIIVSYLQLKATRRRIKLLDAKLQEINQQIEANKSELEKIIGQNKKN